MTAAPYDVSHPAARITFLPHPQKAADSAIAASALTQTLCQFLHIVLSQMAFPTFHLQYTLRLSA